MCPNSTNLQAWGRRLNVATDVLEANKPIQYKHACHKTTVSPAPLARHGPYSHTRKLQGRVVASVGPGLDSHAPPIKKKVHMTKHVPPASLHRCPHPPPAMARRNCGRMIHTISAKLRCRFPELASPHAETQTRTSHLCSHGGDRSQTSWSTAEPLPCARIGGPSAATERNAAGRENTCRVCECENSISCV